MTPLATTTAALLTPLAPGAIAVIGISGPRTLDILRSVLRSARNDTPVELLDRRPTLCRIVEDNRTLDDVVVVRAARSKGETAELNTHGGVRIAQRVLRLLEQHGVQLIGGMDFRESLSADHRVALEADKALLTSRSRRLTNWLLLQRGILPPFLVAAGREQSEDLRDFRQRSEVAIALVAGLEIAIVGPPNAGKSTLANRLIGSEAVITSTTAGTTRDWVSRTAILRGWPVTLTDTAGIRDTDCAIETEAIRRGRNRAHEADLVIVLLDASLPAEVQRHDLERVSAKVNTEQPQLVVRNKCDLGASSPTGTHEDSCLVSAVTGDGLAALECRMACMLGFDLLEEDLPTAFLRRQLEALSQRLNR